MGIKWDAPSPATAGVKPGIKWDNQQGSEKPLKDIGNTSQLVENLLAPGAHFLNQFAMNYPRELAKKAGWNYPESTNALLNASAKGMGVVGGLTSPINKIAGLKILKPIASKAGASLLQKGAAALKNTGKNALIGSAMASAYAGDQPLEEKAVSGAILGSVIPAGVNAVISGLKKSPKFARGIAKMYGHLSEDTLNTLSDPVAISEINKIHYKQGEYLQSEIIPKAKNNILNKIVKIDPKSKDISFLEDVGFKPEEVEQIFSVDKNRIKALKNITSKNLTTFQGRIQTVLDGLGKRIGERYNKANSKGALIGLENAYKRIKGDLDSRMLLDKKGNVLSEARGINNKSIQTILDLYEELRMYGANNKKWVVPSFKIAETKLESALAANEGFNTSIYNALGAIRSAAGDAIPGLSSLNKKYSDYKTLMNLSSKLDDVFNTQGDKLETMINKMKNDLNIMGRKKFENIYGRDISKKIRYLIAARQLYPQEEASFGLVQPIVREAIRGGYRLRAGLEPVLSKVRKISGKGGPVKEYLKSAEKDAETVDRIINKIKTNKKGFARVSGGEPPFNQPAGAKGKTPRAKVTRFSLKDDAGNRTDKYSYFPEKNIWLVSRNYDNHADTIRRAGLGREFDKAVRLIVDHDKKVIGTRTFGSYQGDFNREIHQEGSLAAQRKAAEAFMAAHPDYNKWLPEVENFLDNRTEALDAGRWNSQIINIKKTKRIVGITTATEKVSAIEKLLGESKDAFNNQFYNLAQQKYNNILDVGESTLKNLFNDMPEVKIKVARTVGDYWGIEPTFYVESYLPEVRLNEFMRRMSEAGKGWKQDTIHISEPLTMLPKDVKLGSIDDNGYVFEPDVTVRFKRKLSLKDFSDFNNLLRKEGFAGSTQHKDGRGITFYNVSRGEYGRNADDFTDAANKFLETVNVGGTAGEMAETISQKFGITKREIGVRKLLIIGNEKSGATKSYKEAGRFIPSE